MASIPFRENAHNFRESTYEWLARFIKQGHSCGCPICRKVGAVVKYKFSKIQYKVSWWNNYKEKTIKDILEIEPLFLNSIDNFIQQTDNLYLKQEFISLIKLIENIFEEIGYIENNDRKIREVKKMVTPACLRQGL